MIKKMDFNQIKTLSFKLAEKSFLNSSRYITFTQKEMHIVLLLLKGCKLKEVAKFSCLSFNVVKKQALRINKFLEAKNSYQAGMILGTMLPNKLLFESAEKYRFVQAVNQKQIFCDNKFVKLTVKELQVCTFLLKGLSPKEIGIKLKISLFTVYKYTGGINKKLSVNNHYQAGVILMGITRL